MKTYIWTLILSLLLWTGLVSAFYLPGVAPTNYAEGDSIKLFVNHLTPSSNHMASFKSKGKSKVTVYSYDYYYPKFKFCKPKDGPKKQLESLGAIIFGDRIFDSPFEINMLKEVNCQALCLSPYSKVDSVFVNRNIRAGYSHNWIVDGLPAARHVTERRTNTDFYSPGFPIGSVDDEEQPHLHNHYIIHIEYHKRNENNFRVVGVVVEAASLDRNGIDESKASPEQLCDADLPPVTLSNVKDSNVLFTYSVKFVESETAWATRWDKYLHVYDPKIQWVSLINFSVVVVILAIIMAHILVSTLKNDIIKYNEINLDDDVAYESGWKLAYGDVFRSPSNRMLLSVLVGSGTQIFCMILVTIVFALFGLLSPSNRGALSTFMFILFIFFGIISSYVSGYIYRFFGGENWKLNLILTPTVVPGILFGVFAFLNFFLIHVNSSGAIPVGTMAAIIVIWFLISLPLSVVGSIWQSKRSTLSVPVRTNQIPRQIPPQHWYLRTVPAMIMCGLFPFGSIAVELYFIYSSLWFNRIYYMFGFLFFCFVLMVLTTGLISVLSIYYTLCSENYKWQWKSIFVGGGCSLYVFVHSLFFIGDEAFANFTSLVLFVGYSGVISFLVFLVCGAVGFLSNLFFVRKIYSQIKID
ncbi:endosomal P24A protein precursor [Metschnikowia bicuspidata var. bicuspidata NRRL YB-4993]|uniref:Transmembrane 9 superfamily member n=1 Tax=Metschnikowia bicuspidata var. bicuspidata NRRL YB-4993 TaxID=869754 RepID=A0A1A0H555_9ASCO|nr:endosomal P24A protein precursor [Metschnikowia bicuspidata var. bicuspidata NRRL YB-4993]OBA19053.1 endosomal P24A protein precursor [Metschnikowia bicuspidata var. bicuspidata NRRL YB-4993]